MPRVGSKAALAAYLEGKVGIVVNSSELQKAANGAVEWARRLRDLRAEGWDISSHNDRADLAPGQYILEKSPPTGKAYKFASPISHRLRALVLTRNGCTCQMCGMGAGDKDDEGRKVRLHIGHIVDRSHGGKDEQSNLRALCSTCNQGAKNLAIEPPSWTWLLAQLRRATRADQQVALAWLKQKFESADEHSRQGN